MKFCTVLVAAMLMSIAVYSQKDDIEVFEKKDGNKNIVIARNTGKVSYLVTVTIDATGMDVSPAMEVESVIPAGYMKEMASITPRPGEAWSYGYDVSFVQYTGQALKAADPPASIPETQPAPKANVPVPVVALSKAPIILYTQVGCGRCTYMKKEMNARGIAFEEVDVNSGSPEVNAMWKQMRDEGFSGDNVTMPVVKVNGQISYNIKDLAGFINGLKE